MCCVICHVCAVASALIAGFCCHLRFLIDVVCRSGEPQNSQLCVSSLCVIDSVQILFDESLITSVSFTAQAMGTCGMIYKTSKRMTKTAMFMA